MSWLSRFQALRRRGILGMNRRNTLCILDLNPRSRFPLVDAKQKLAELCGQIGVPTPALYASVRAHSALRELPRLLEGRPEFVIKPNRGAAGRGILVITGVAEGMFLRHDGRRLSFSDVRQHASNIISGLFSLGGQSDEVLIQQRVVPDPVLAPFSFQGTADIRVILYKAVPMMAMLRLPTRRSGGRANLHQGAIGAGVDMTTGITTHAVQDNRITDRHPDTGVPVIGFQVPYWAEILDMSRRVAKAVDLGYLGVDVVLDQQQGPLLLEANARPGLAIQIANGQGLLPRFEMVDCSLPLNPTRVSS